MTRATGEFEVNMQPLTAHAAGRDGVTLGRMALEKIFQGELAAESRGEMLSAITAVEGSAGYVAIEQVSGTLHGRGGSFVLQHFGIMQGAASRLVLEVVPDSGTGDLAGLSGTMAIQIDDDGRHSYTFDYALA